MFHTFTSYVKAFIRRNEVLFIRERYTHLRLHFEFDPNPNVGTRYVGASLCERPLTTWSMPFHFSDRYDETIVREHKIQFFLLCRILGGVRPPTARKTAYIDISLRSGTAYSQLMENDRFMLILVQKYNDYS